MDHRIQRNHTKFTRSNEGVQVAEIKNRMKTPILLGDGKINKSPLKHQVIQRNNSILMKQGLYFIFQRGREEMVELKWPVMGGLSNSMV